MATELPASDVNAAVTCQNCGFELGTDASFCPECGTELAKPTTTPDNELASTWRYALIGGVGLTLVGLVVGGAVEESSTAYDTGILSYLVGYATIIAAVYLDTKHVTRTTDWSPNRWLWVGGSVLPSVNVLVAGLYLYYRRDAEPTTSPAAPDTETVQNQSSPPTTEEDPAPPSTEQPPADDPKESADTDGSTGADGDTTQPATVSVTPDQIYTTDGGVHYVETPIGPDKRLQTDGGTPYYERGSAMRALYGGLAVACVGAALFLIVVLPDAAGGPASPRARQLFGLVTTIPFGNVLVGLLALWFAYVFGSTASGGREYVTIQDEGADA